MAEETAAGQVATGENNAPEAGVQHRGTSPSGAVDLPSQETPEQRRARFEQAIGKDGEFADLYQQGVDNAVKTRLARERAKAEKAMAAQQPVLDLLMSRYGVKDIDQLQEAIQKDASWWQTYADGKGITEEQAREQIAIEAKMDAIKRHSAAQDGERRVQAQMQLWAQQAQEVLTAYPEFDLQAAVQNPDFLSMLKSGVNMRVAYEVVNMDAIKRSVAHRATKDAETRLTESIRAGGTRPVEVGTGGQPGAITKTDPGKLSGKEINDIMARVARGERVSFG